MDKVQKHNSFNTCQWCYITDILLLHNEKLAIKLGIYHSLGLTYRNYLCNLHSSDFCIKQGDIKYIHIFRMLRYSINAQFSYLGTSICVITQGEFK